MSLRAELAGELPDRNPPVREAEQRLIRRARVDREAFAALYRAHVRTVSDYVYRRTGDPDLTQDLVSDVFVRALRAFPRFESRGIPLRHWLLRIATNRLASWAVRRRIAVSLDAVPEPALEPLPQSPRAAVARRALQHLPARYQAALSLFHIEGLDVAEVASILSCGEGTVKSRLARGRALLRDAIVKMEEHDEPRT